MLSLSSIRPEGSLSPDISALQICYVIQCRSGFNVALMPTSWLVGRSTIDRQWTVYGVLNREKTGEGKMTIVNIDDGKDVAVKMEFFKPMSGEGMVHWITNAKSDSTTEMIWSFEQDLTYFNRYFGLMMDMMMGKHFERGLSNFKNLVEGAN